MGISSDRDVDVFDSLLLVTGHLTESTACGRRKTGSDLSSDTRQMERDGGRRYSNADHARLLSCG
jgi:hypothetical protein